MRPLIGVTASDKEGRSFLRDAYLRAIERAGGLPVLLPAADEALAAALAERVDGVLFSGGGDLGDAAVYGDAELSLLGGVSPRRDAFETALARYLLTRTQKPMLGVCRGAQVMNAAFGGTLYADLRAAGKEKHNFADVPRGTHTHRVSLAPSGRLASILGAAEIGVNSFHHQAVRRAAPGFFTSAHAIPDGVIEAIELPGERFVLGVQWHPEDLAEQSALFAAFVAAARGTK